MANHTRLAILVDQVPTKYPASTRKSLRTAARRGKYLCVDVTIVRRTLSASFMHARLPVTIEVGARQRHSTCGLPQSRADMLCQQ